MHSHEAELEALKRENERLRLIGARDRRLFALGADHYAPTGGDPDEIVDAVAGKAA